MPAVARYRPRVSDGMLIWATIFAEWALALAAIVTDRDSLVGHEAVLRPGSLPPLLVVAQFFVAWQVMTAAMMLPSSLPMVRLFAGASRGQARTRLVLATFLSAYFGVWTLFALTALLTDTVLHTLADQWSWLDRRPGLVTGTVLMLAGAFQFSTLKERCLRACRTPLAFLRRHYRRGLRASSMVGARYRLSCLGCCWALMLVMFAVGVGSIAWMVGLSAVMLFEKTSRRGHLLVPYAGVALLVIGLVTSATSL